MESHLLQMRGLKLRITDNPYDLTSHLLQMRGLKPLFAQQWRASDGRIFYRCVD